MNANLNKYGKAVYNSTKASLNKNLLNVNLPINIFI